MSSIFYMALVKKEYDVNKWEEIPQNEKVYLVELSSSYARELSDEVHLGYATHVEMDEYKMDSIKDFYESSISDNKRYLDRAQFELDTVLKAASITLQDIQEAVNQFNSTKEWVEEENERFQELLDEFNFAWRVYQKQELSNENPYKLVYYYA